MKHIHIVEPYHSIAMKKHELPLTNNLNELYEITVSGEIDPEADCNIHFPWHTLAGKDKGESRHIIAYTHCNPGAEDSLLDACERADVIAALTFTGRRDLVSLGVDPKKIWVIPCAANDYLYRKRRVMVVSYVQPDGRKRESLLLDLAWQYNLNAYEFVLVGFGWEDTAERLRLMKVAVQTHHTVGYEELTALYHQADALLVTGYVEGGPLPVLEAMAMGVKVFSPRFGYAADLLQEGDLYDTPADLMQKISAHFAPGIYNSLLVNMWGWGDYVREYGLIIGRLLGESVDVHPEFGVSRYAQLLDIVDEVKPQSIVEIGTWRGATAIRMLQQAAKWRPMESLSYQGFDLFEGQTGADLRSELSKSGWPQELVQRRLSATGAHIELVKGYTRDTLFTRGKGDADLYFIDGGHSEETIENDGMVVHSMKRGAVAVFDDYYLEGRPEGMGCNRFIESLSREKFKVTFLPAVTRTDSGRVIGMVRVEKRKENNADIRLQRWETQSGSFADYRASVSWVPDTLHTPALS